MLDSFTQTQSVSSTYKIVDAKVNLAKVQSFKVGRVVQRDITKFELVDKELLGYNTVYVMGRFPTHKFREIKLVLRDKSLFGVISTLNGRYETMMPSSQFEGQIDHRFLQILPRMALFSATAIHFIHPGIFEKSTVAQYFEFLSSVLLATVLYGIFSWNIFQEKHGTHKQVADRTKELSMIYWEQMRRPIR